ncbi:hypothetical protein BJY00DRAFT_306745 [Aspergillus carlsbadensis]|nr:hypothetical protein BJY00DRAFT_306745 [Aspergillus carlsbadensis]
MSSKRTVLITGCSDGSLGSHLALQFHAAGWRVFASARNMAKLKHAKEVAFLPLLLASTHENGALLINHGSLSGTIAASGPFAGAYNASKAAVASFTETMRLELEPFGIKVINLVTGAVRSTFHVNAPHPQLPAISLYNVTKEAKGAIETAMGNPEDASDTDPEVWARGVVRELGKRNPAYWIWAGKFSSLVRWGSLLPLGFFDRVMKRMVGLDVVEREVKARGYTQPSSCGGGGDSGVGKI